jgi:hypothetical protein
VERGIGGRRETAAGAISPARNPQRFHRCMTPRRLTVGEGGAAMRRECLDEYELLSTHGAEEFTQRRNSGGLSHWQLHPAPLGEGATSPADDEPTTYHTSWDPNAYQVDDYSQRFGLRCVPGFSTPACARAIPSRTTVMCLVPPSGGTPQGSGWRATKRPRQEILC